MPAVHANQGIKGVAPVGTENPPSTTESARLTEPNVARQGNLPTTTRAGWSPFGGRLITGAVVAVIAAVSLPFMSGCSLADTHREPTAVEAVQGGEVQAGQTTVRGQFVEAPVPGGDQPGIWLVPLSNQNHFDIDGQQYERLYIGVAGTDLTNGLTPGSVGDLHGIVLPKLDGDSVIAVVSTIDKIVSGLPRDMQGAVRLGAAPGAEPGADAKDLFLVLDAPIWVNGNKVEDVHLGAADAPTLAGLEPGDQLTLGGRVDINEHGAWLASASAMTAQHYPGSDVQSPTFDGVSFHPAGAANVTLPAIDLPGADANRRHVVVVDTEMGIAHLGSVAHAPESASFDATLDVQAYLQGGPAFKVDAGTVFHDVDGKPLEPRMTWVEHGADGDRHQGWYLHEASNTLYQLSFHLDADGQASPADVTHAIDLNAAR